MAYSSTVPHCATVRRAKDMLREFRQCIPPSGGAECHWPAAAAGPTGQSEQFVLSEMHSLDNISAVVENAANVLGVHGTREVRVAIVFPVRHCNFLQKI